jgi:hypothetical protein
MPMRKTERKNEILAINPEPPEWRLVPIELPPTVLTMPPRVFLAEEDRRIWRYTSPRFRGIPRLCSPPLSLAKRRLDDAATQTDRPARVHRGVQVDGETDDSEWETEDKASQAEIPPPAEAPPLELPTVSSTQSATTDQAEDINRHRREQHHREPRHAGRAVKPRRAETPPRRRASPVRRRHSTARSRATTPARRRERTPTRQRHRHTTVSERKRHHRR